MSTVKHLTKTTVTALKPGQIIRDTVVKGFGARMRQNAITYFVSTRINGKKTWLTIGKHGSPWTVETARDHARDLLHDARKGIVPVKPTAAVTPTGLAFEDAFNMYIASRAGHNKPRTITEYKRIITVNVFPILGSRDIASISKADIKKIHRDFVATPASANHILAVLKTFFYWLEGENLRPQHSNPCTRLKKYRSNNRARFLTIDDITRLADAMRVSLTTGEASTVQISAILLLMFTGARRTEIFTLKRCYVDRHRKLAHLPDSKTGAKVIHLNAPAMTILNNLPEWPNNPYYLVGRKTGGCITEIKKPWDKIRKRAKLEGFRLHDFRHSFASFAADGGADARAIGKLLGHASIETTKLYIHLFAQRPRETADATGSTIKALMSPKRPHSSTDVYAQQPMHSDPLDHIAQELFFPAHCG